MPRLAIPSAHTIRAFRAAVNDCSPAEAAREGMLAVIAHGVAFPRAAKVWRAECADGVWQDDTRGIVIYQAAYSGRYSRAVVFTSHDQTVAGSHTVIETHLSMCLLAGTLPYAQRPMHASSDIHSGRDALLSVSKRILHSVCIPANNAPGRPEPGQLKQSRVCRSS
jgi:hypothetical protein